MVMNILTEGKRVSPCWRRSSDVPLVVAAGDVGANKKYNRPRCAVCCHGLFGAEKVVEFSVGAGKAFRSEGSQPLDDNASFHGRRRLQRWGRTPRVFRHDQSLKEKCYPK